LFKRPLKFLRELDGRIKVAIAGTGIQNLGQNLTGQYNQLYAVDLGADAVELGLLNSISAIISSIVSIPLGWATEKYGVKKVMLLGFVCAAVSATIFASAWGWWILIPAFILGRGLVRIMPLTDIIFITSTKPSLRATVMSFSRVVWGVINIFAPMVAAFIVASFGGIKADGIRPLYYIQIVLSIFVFLFVAWKLQPLLRNDGKKKLTSGSNLSGFLRDFQDFFKGEKWLKRWMILRITQQFGMNLALPFTSLWLVNVKGATPYILGIMGTASVFISLVLQIPAGRLADKIGRKKVYFLLRPFSFLGTALLILAPRPEYLIAVGSLGALTMGGGGGSGIGGVSFIPFITMFWEMVPSEKRGRLFGIEGLMNIATVPATIIGGILWQQGFMAEILFLPILLEVLVVMPILFTIPDTLKSDKQ